MTICETIIRQASIYDGTGAEPETADLAIKDGRIAALGDLSQSSAGAEIDAAGLAVSPGFIDVHTHDDRALIDTHMSFKTSQGVTTVVAGNCGVSLAPLTLDLVGAAPGDGRPRP